MIKNIKEILIINDKLIETLKSTNDRESQDIATDLVDSLRIIKQLYKLEKKKSGLSDIHIENILNKYFKEN